MVELKTKVNDASVDKFLQGIKDEKKRGDCYQILKIMKKATKAEPKMWAQASSGLAIITTSTNLAARTIGS